VAPLSPKSATPSRTTKAEQRQLLLKRIKELVVLIFQNATWEVLLEKVQLVDQCANCLLQKPKQKN
jgi:hypothetical protein